MRLAAVTAALTISAGAATFARADEPPPVTVTVERTIENRGVEWWARRAKQARRDANKRGDTITALHRSLRAGVRLGGTGLERAFLCIHFFEGSWTDPNAPYYGGLQMDRDFQSSYGPWAVRAWGTADRWPVVVQVAVAMRAFFAGRGFHPWPNTAARCGLL